MKKLSFHRSQVFVGLFTMFVILTSSFGRLGVVHASPTYLSDPPANQVAVKLKAWTPINAILARYNATQIDLLTETNLYILQLSGNQPIDQVLQSMNSDYDLWFAEPNYYTETAPDGTTIGFRGTTIGFRGTTIGFRGTGDLTPTPVGGADQWAWLKIGLADAHKMSTGQSAISGQQVIVAVLDTGMVGDHTLSLNNIEAGFDFVNMTASFLDSGNHLDDDRNGATDDFVGHGTHISGIIISTAPNARVMPIRVLNSDGVGTYTDVARGIRFAVDQKRYNNKNVRVISMSLTAPRLTPELSSALAYAAANGVIVVTAAGNNDPGPNYPAHYSDPLAVITVGAIDRNDAIASFSGGFAGDIDVFAPGVDIVSSYPYPRNSYALGSGTSMAAPIVAGEAALLVADHPDWSATEIEQRIISKGATVSGSSARRIDLVAALSTGVEVDAGTLDPNASPTDAGISPRLRVSNNTPNDIPLTEIKLRYWYTVDGARPQAFACDYATTFNCSNPANIGAAFTALASGHANLTSLSDTYAEIGFTSGAGNLMAGTNLEMYLKIYKTDISPYNELNDYSYLDPNKPVMTRWERITAYRNGTLVWGIEPTSSTILTSTPTRTPTLYVPTATFTRTSTSVLVTATYTNTKTQTAAPTATKTATSAAAATATATKTSTTVAAATATVAKTSTTAPAATATVVRTSTTAPIIASPTRTNTPVPATATPGSAACTVITGSGSYNITTGTTCFKYVNTAWPRGGIFSVGNWSSPAVNTIKWYGGGGESSTSCANNTQALVGNGAQLSNFSISRDINGAMYLTITGSEANTVSLSLYQWVNGPGCSATPTPGP